MANELTLEEMRKDLLGKLYTEAVRCIEDDSLKDSSSKIEILTRTLGVFCLALPRESGG